MPAPVDPASRAAGTIPAAFAALLDLDEADRQDAGRLLVRSGHTAPVDAALTLLRQRLGTFPARWAPDGGLGQDAWICAILKFVPELAAWHAARSIDPAVTAASLADVGRQFRLHRVTHRRFGLETWDWLTLMLSGSLFQLGRLQFALRDTTGDPVLPPGTGDWVLDVHIPPTGPLRRAEVEESFAQAAAFFRQHFADRPTQVAVCCSWLLDPYLLEALPGSNIAGFQELFRPYGEPRPSRDDVLYFVFRVRDGAALDQLPRDTALQRVVLDRLCSGGKWVACHGFRRLPD